MKDDGDKLNRSKRRSTPASRQGGYVGRGNADDGRSGYGSESVRPYLRAQLRLKELMQGPQLGQEPGDRPNAANGQRKKNAPG